MSSKGKIWAVLVTALLLVTPSLALAHDTPNPDGHVTATANYGFEPIAHDVLVGVTDGLYTDVWSHNGYAYVGSFQEPACTRAGVFIVDIEQAIANGVDSDASAMVAQIKSPPNTRVNDVKVHTVTTGNKTRDVLILTEEKCGAINGNGKQLGQGGISLWDVTDPTNPHALKQHFLDSEIHNTFPWTADDGRSYLIAVDDIELDDVIVVDITKPQSPKEVGRIGIGTWLDTPDHPIADDGQLFTGVFAAPLLHDVWVEKTGDQWQAVLSYWDAGFVMLDVSDPTDPQYLGDSTYPDPDPIFGTSPAEGNGHAAVFGGAENEYLFSGDEDFDPFQVTIKDADGVAHAASQGSDVPQIGPDSAVVGTGRYVGLACSAIDAAVDASDIAIIQRGDCAFTDKAGNAEAAGYQGAIVFNHATGCQESVSMSVEAGIPALFVPRVDGFELLGLGDQYDPNSCDGSGADQGDALLSEGIEAAIDISADFDGWGYFHVQSNLPGGDTTLAPPSVPGESPDDREVIDVDYLGELGYFAPAELVDPAFAVGFGDQTMHNLEADPLTEATVPTFDEGPRSFISWYSLGMRAVEYRPGHFHEGDGGVYSWNVHEVGQWIDPNGGSNFWGVHIDEDADGNQIILGSDRNTGLWIFTFACESEVLNDEGGDTGLYCRRD